jgi:hypothetical protein
MRLLTAIAASWQTPVIGLRSPVGLRNRAVTIEPAGFGKGILARLIDSTAARSRTPALDALIESLRSKTGKDFAAERRAVERLGVAGMDAQ